MGSHRCEMGSDMLKDSLEKIESGRWKKCEAHFMRQGLSAVTKGWFWLIQHSIQPDAVRLLLV